VLAIQFLIVMKMRLYKATTFPSPSPIPPSPQRYNAFLNALRKGIICTFSTSHTPPST
jgi:hypothetical protein